MSIGATLPLALPMPTLEPVVTARRRAARRTLGAVLSEAEMGEVALFEFAGGHAAVFTTRAPNKETANEDAAGLLPASELAGVLAVADGLGGHAGGERASRLALDTLQETIHAGVTLTPEANGDWLRGAILDGIEAANAKVRELGSGAATTLALVEIQGRVIRPYHVGDSVILLTGQRGKIKLQTIAHSPIGYAVEAGLMNEEDAIHHEERHVISNVIGSEQMRIEIGAPIDLALRDTLIVASDGLVDNLLPHEIADFVRSGPLDRAVRAMVDEALRRMTGSHSEKPSKPDDLTVIAYRPT